MTSSKYTLLAVFIHFGLGCYAQNGTDTTKSDLPAKILHAEPLYIDLIRDLGARKGEKEWNVGAGMIDRLNFDSYEFLVEYEWAPLNRWGVEIEVPVTIYSEPNQNLNQIKPSNRIESIKLASQYTFLVAPKPALSLAIGGITEFEFTDLDKITSAPVFRGIVLNPFLIGAKRWGNSFHTLIYTGPKFITHFDTAIPNEFSFEVNTNFHYMIADTRNFIGFEFNKTFTKGDFDMIIRPQMRLCISDGLMIGIVPGIPVSKSNRRLSAFIRLIYEPGHSHKK